MRKLKFIPLLGLSLVSTGVVASCSCSMPIPLSTDYFVFKTTSSTTCKLVGPKSYLGSMEEVNIPPVVASGVKVWYVTEICPKGINDVRPEARYHKCIFNIPYCIEKLDYNCFYECQPTEIHLYRDFNTWPKGFDDNAWFPDTIPEKGTFYCESARVAELIKKHWTCFSKWTMKY